MQSLFKPVRKPARKWLLQLAVSALIAFSLLLLFHFTQNTEKSQPQTQGVSQAAPGSPLRLIIPSINVNANIQPVGVNSKGEMDVPSNTVDVGWYGLGPRPGENGSAVISGHFDGKLGKSGVFKNLDQLKPGDQISVTNDQGTTTTFVVKESRIYNPGYADEVFLSAGGGSHLNLVTCDGVWDKAEKSYTKRLVVFADII